MVPDLPRPLPRPRRRVLVGLVVALVATLSLAACSSDEDAEPPGATSPAAGGTTPGAAPETGSESASTAGSGSVPGSPELGEGPVAYCERVDQLLGVLEPVRLAEPDVDENEDAGEAEPDEPADEREAFEPLEELARVAAYDRLVVQVRELAPAEHARAWEHLAAVSEEPFSYERFNPAVDELERIGDDLEARCPDLGRFVVDDDGRLTRW